MSVDLTPFGAYDMVGSVCEWVADWYQAYPGSLYHSEQFGQKFKVMRGGAAGTTNEEGLRCASRLYDEPEKYYSDVGFRCACDINELGR